MNASIHVGASKTTINTQIMKPRTQRQEYIAVLRNLSDKVGLLPSDKRELYLLGELIEGGYVRGEIICDQMGEPLDRSIKGLTNQGRLFLQDLQTMEDNESLRAKLRQAWSAAWGFGGGVIAAILVEWIKNMWWPPAIK